MVKMQDYILSSAGRTLIFSWHKTIFYSQEDDISIVKGQNWYDYRVSYRCWTICVRQQDNHEVESWTI